MDSLRLCVSAAGVRERSSNREVLRVSNATKNKQGESMRLVSETNHLPPVLPSCWI